MAVRLQKKSFVNIRIFLFINRPKFLLHLFQLLKLITFVSRNFTRAMYNRNKKDNYRNKIEELIGGRKKCSRKGSSGSKTSNNDADNDVIINVDGSSNDNTNDDNTSNIFEDINVTSSNIDSTNKIRIQKWIPDSIKVEGIRKYLGTNKISHN